MREGSSRLDPNVTIDGRLDARSLVVAISMGLLHIGLLAWSMALLQ